MTDNVTPFTLVPKTSKPSASVDMGGHSFIDALEELLVSEGIKLEFTVDDVDLDMAEPDERRLGALNAYERRAFITGSVLQEYIRVEINDADAHTAQAIADLMREKKIDHQTALIEHAQSRETPMPPEVQRRLNVASVAAANLLPAYEWSLRNRYDEWMKPLIVRREFEAYSYG